ncbi:inorganic phosphate transporter [Hymenobacter sp. NBH84]|uniref:inorganic phosphate transporter n=1 Tax=Hymenobacter sp. NBH84 TaxID=2596915 RepID=UPI0027E4B1B6|nr:inorganic phosphate transporter [Hymenobacter sp. NBH84]
MATVIYTNTLRPWVAVVWSAFWNFIGVFSGGIGVAMGIIYLLPVESLVDQNVYHGIAMVGALILAAIIWNVGTWYYGLPSSSSHALIGSILGVGIAFSLISGGNGSGVNWGKAGEAGLALLVGPLFGFTLTILLMYMLKRFVKSKTIFKEPHKRKPPPLWIRLTLVTTCTLVSFFHGFQRRSERRGPDYADPDWHCAYLLRHRPNLEPTGHARVIAAGGAGDEQSKPAGAQCR